MRIQELIVNVVSLRECRDLLQCWAEVRSLVAKGRSFAVCVEGLDGEETVVLGGQYRNDRAAALKASMRVSWELTRATEKPPAVASSS